MRVVNCSEGQGSCMVRKSRRWCRDGDGDGEGEARPRSLVGKRRTIRTGAAALHRHRKDGAQSVGWMCELHT